MNPETRQSLIGVIGLSAVMIVALLEGFNGKVTATYFVAVVAIVAPQSLKELRVWFRK